MLKVEVSAELIVRFLTEGNEMRKAIVEQGLPPGCTLELVSFKYERGAIILYFEEPTKDRTIKEKHVIVKAFE